MEKFEVETKTTLIFNQHLKNTIIKLIEIHGNEQLKSIDLYDLEDHHIKIRKALSEELFFHETCQRKLSLDNRDYPNMFILMLCFGIGHNILNYNSFQEVLDSYRDEHKFLSLNELILPDNGINQLHCCCGHSTCHLGTFNTPNKEGYSILNGDTCITKNKIICKETMNKVKKPRNDIKKKIAEKIKNMRQKCIMNNIKKLFTIWKESKTYISFYLPTQLKPAAQEFAKQKFTLKYDPTEWTSKKWSVVSSIHEKYFEKVEVQRDMTSFYDKMHRKEMKFKFQLVGETVHL
jgi:hypothetical protein